MQHRIWAIALVLIAVNSLAKAEDWPSFRGPAGNGISNEQHVPTHWGPEQNIKWKVALPAAGDSSPIVSNGRVFITCAADEGRQRSLYCFDRADGRLRWMRSVEFDKIMPTHKTNAYCGSTPAADGQRVVVWHSSAGLYCYDFQGNQLWQRDLGEFRHLWGYGTSPVLHDGRVILHSGPGESAFVASLDPESGETLWKTAEPLEGNGEQNENGKYMGSWCTPIIVNVDGRELIVCDMPTRVNAYDPNSGDIVWSCRGLRGRKGDLAYASPVIAGDICVAMGGFNGPAIGFRMSGAGDITDTHRLWHVEPNPQRIGSGVTVGKHIYVANAGRNTFQCIEPATGKIVWEERSRGAAHWGSLVYAGGRLYVTDQDGTTHILLPDPEKLVPVASNRLDEPSNSTPAISDGQLFIRTFDHLFCISET